MNANTDLDIAPLPALILDPILERAFAEDLGRAGDLTSDTVIPHDVRAQGRAVARQGGRVAGAALAMRAFHMVDPTIRVDCLCRDGMALVTGETILHVEGPARSVLTGERVALNMLGHLSGIASATDALVNAVRHTKARIVCTRKTTPGLRALEKFAVRCGGGFNHRFGLDDGILIKDNHIAVTGNIAAAVAAARAKTGHMIKIEVEADTLEQVDEAVTAGADAILLDNMSPATLSEAVALINGRAVSEASGGITLETVAAVAESGVDYISSGAITHSAPSLDIGLDFTARG